MKLIDLTPGLEVEVSYRPTLREDAVTRKGIVAGVRHFTGNARPHVEVTVSDRNGGTFPVYVTAQQVRRTWAEREQAEADEQRLRDERAAEAAERQRQQDERFMREFGPLAALLNTIASDIGLDVSMQPRTEWGRGGELPLTATVTVTGPQWLLATLMVELLRLFPDFEVPGSTAWVKVMARLAADLPVEDLNRREHETFHPGDWRRGFTPAEFSLFVHAVRKVRDVGAVSLSA